MNIIKKLFSFTIRSAVMSILLFLTIALIGAYVFISGVSNADVPNRILASDSDSPVTVTDREGNELAVIQPENGVIRVVSSDRISQNMKDAMVAAEDGTFWQNLGFEPRRILGATLGHLQGNPNAGGGSGLTQQYVKNNLVGDDYSLQRKWDEILSATKTTATRDKEQILTDYLNSVYFGRGATGIEQASRAYFGVSAEELSLPQSALLAGVVQSPSQWDPEVDPDGAHERFDYVLGQMERWGMITPEQASTAEFPETIPSKPVDVSTGMTDGATGLIAHMAIEEIVENGIEREVLFDRGVTIRTTIDPAVHESIQRNSKNAAQTHDVRLGVASVDPANGAIRGFYGGDDGYGFNYATNSQMTGSVFKVFALAAAIKNGIGINTMIDSSPYQTGGITIHNSDGMTCGTCSIAEATKQSLNTSYHRIQDMLPEGAYSTRQMAQDMGVTASLSEPDGSVAGSIVLGAYGTSPVDMAAGYATISSGGVHREQHIVEEVTSRFGKPLYTTEVEEKRVLDTAQAGQIDTALAPIADYSNGHGLANEQGFMKTGTVQRGDGSSTGQNRDAWTVGYTKGPDSLSTSVWVGSDDGRALYDAYGAMIWGANLPADVWKSIMDEVG